MAKKREINPILIIGGIILVVVAVGAISFFSNSSAYVTTVSTILSTTTVIATLNATVNVTNSTVYRPTNETSEVAAVYPNTTASTFSCNANYDCVLVHTTSCFNNLPSQQACINNQSYGAYESSYETYLANRSTVCPDYMAVGESSCACINQGCSLIYTR